MRLPEQEIKLQLALDPATGEETGAVDAMVSAFPIEIRPRISTVFHLAESVFSASYIVLTVFAVGSWVAKRVLAPVLDEIGNCLRDAVFAYGRKGRRQPPGVGLYIAQFENVEVRVSIPTESLLSWKNEEGQFRKLAEYILEGFPEVTSRRAARVTLMWNPDARGWVFCDIWPADMGSAYHYYIFNPQSRTWEERSLSGKRDNDSRGPG